MNIPIVRVHLKEDRALKYEIPKYVTMAFEGKGSSLMGLHLLWKSDIKFILDLSTINYNWECQLNNYLNWVRLPPGYENIKKKILQPEVITIELDRREEMPILVQHRRIYYVSFDCKQYLKSGCYL